MADDDLTLAIQRFPLLEYVQGLGAGRVGQYEFVLECPECRREKLSVNMRKRQWRCFICEEYGPAGLDGRPTIKRGGGGVFQLVEWMERFSARDAARFILDRGRPPQIDPNVLPDPAFWKPDELRKPAELTPTGLPENTVAVGGRLPYLERRGISLEDARVFGLGVCTTGWLANRLVFPVWENGECIYWQARAMWDQSEHPTHLGKFRKTLNPSIWFCRWCRLKFADGFTRCHVCGAAPQYGSGDVLLNLDNAKRFPRVAITEGPTSCIRAGPSAVATFGKQLQPRQIARLVHAGVRAVDFMWDGPSEKEPHGAWAQMIQAASSLAPFMDVRLVFLPKGDPGDYPREYLDHLRRRARPFGHHGDLL